MMKLWEFVNELKSPAYCWVDLTHELSPATPHWYGFGDLTTEVIYDFSPDCIFHSDKYVIPAGQFGTHVDAPGHFVQGARTLDQMTLKEMVYPLVVVDKSAACAANADYELTIADLQEWEQEHGPIPEGAFVAFRSDWSKRPDMNNYDENNQPHYPGWKLDALQMSDSNDMLRCLVNSAVMQAILLKNLTSGNERAVQSVFSILELNSEWSQSVYFETYMENVLKSRQKVS